MRTPAGKIMTLDAAVAWREGLARAGRTLVLTNGCFDLLHRGHVEYLAAARARGDALLVLLNADASVRALKGPGRPLVKEDDRALTLAALEAVDAVTLFAAPRCTAELERLRPDTYIKGGDYSPDTIDREEKRTLAKVGARIEFVPLLAGYSTSDLLARICGTSSRKTKGRGPIQAEDPDATRQ